nr:SWIM zinc finger family protein [Variovorax paradoxus]
MAWHDGYRAYDDDTLATLANPGLLRRAAKDVEAGKIAWAEQGTEAGVVTADGQRVQLDARGPQQARCDCPAPGICKHILGAALWLRALEPAAPGSAGGAPSDEQQDRQAPPGADPLAEILALDAAALFKAAGVAAVRRAAAAASSVVEWRVQGGALLMDLPELGASCRWVAGAGYAGMVSEVPAAERKAVHLIAIAALRSAHGQPFAWPESARPAPVEDTVRLG